MRVLPKKRERGGKLHYNFFLSSAAAEGTATSVAV